MNGVDKYATGRAVIEIHFSDGVIDCRHCPYIGTNYVLECAYCKLTGTYVDKVNLRKRALDCPVKFEQEELNEQPSYL